MTRVPGTRAAPSEVVVEMARLKGLSDSVVAFALTVLVLDVRLPALVTDADLVGDVLALGPKLLIYLISFAIVGGAWGSHQRMLGQISRGDGLLVWFNLLSLLPITLLPACAVLLGDFPKRDVAVAIFGADALAIQITAYLLWRHAASRGLVDPSLDGMVVAGIGRRSLVNALGFALSIPLAFIAPLLDYALWVAVFALVFTTDWVSWRQAIRTTRETIVLDGTTQALVELRHGDGHLHIDAVEGHGVLLEGVFGGGVERAVHLEHDHAHITIKLPRVGGLLDPRYPWAWGRFSADWDLGLTRRIPVSLAVETKAGTADLDLDELQLTQLDIRADASTVRARLPAGAGVLRVAVVSKAAAVTLQIPDGVAVWVHSETDIPELELDLARVPATVDLREWRSVDYDTAPDRVDLSVSSAAGAIRLTGAGGPAAAGPIW